MIDQQKAKRLKFFVILFGFLGSFSIIVMVFMPQPDYQSDLSRADPTLGSPRVDEIAETLASGEPYVDPLLESTLGQEMLTDDVRSAADAAGTPVHLVVASLSAADSINDPEVLLSRIVHAVDRDGLFVFIDQDSRSTYEFRKQGRTTSIHLADMFGEVDESILVSAFESVDNEAGDGASSDDDPNSLAARTMTGAWFGATLSVPIWYLMKLIRWAARRNRSYLEGFS